MTQDLGTVAALAAATLLSEDLSCIAAGLLASAGHIRPATGIAGCALGIAAGDLALWGLGRLAGPAVLTRPWVARRLPASAVDRAGSWIGSRLGRAVVMSRFLPGSRLPFFVVAGATRQPALPMVLWTVAAALVWAPLLIGLAAVLGEAFASWFGTAAATAPWAALVGALVCLGASRLARRGRGIAGAGPAVPSGSRGARWTVRSRAALARLRRHEYWPAWLLYLPLAPWIGILALRHRGFGTIAAANPGIPGGGFVGESKAQILAGLPPDAVLPFALIPPGEPHERAEALLAVMRRRGWSWPIVLKPDAGQRGAGVRLIHDEARARAYLREHPAAALAQVHHPGPHEAGIFYYRIPGEARGRILSITDKVFPVVVGDGSSRLEDLIWADRRHRVQARVYLRRLGDAAGRVPAAGEAVRLAEAGNHCQGTMFRDGEHLRTRELESTMDAIARAHPGFCFGRFDLRYADASELRRGRGFGIIELNGVTSESTNIYDPSWSVWRAWAMLARQWSLLFRIGAENRRRGAAVTPARELLRAAWRHSHHPALGVPSD